MMKVWVVIRRGVYRHELGGVFSSEVSALTAANDLLEKEPDNWHNYEIIPAELDQTAPFSYEDAAGGEGPKELPSITVLNHKPVRRGGL